jgi:two-component system chemotaxis sensor kinase CheA
MDELIGEFITETNESLEELDVDLVNLEKDPNDRDLLSKIFRLMHTIKGTCGFLGLPRLEKLAHHAENVLGRFRDGDLDVTPPAVTLIFESIDGVRFILEGIETNGAEPDGDDSGIISRLDAVYEGRDPAEAGASADKSDTIKLVGDKIDNSDGEEEEVVAADEMSLADIDDIFTQNAPLPTIAAKEAEPEQAPVETPVAAGVDDGTPEVKTAKKASIASQSLRVNVEVLENLMTMVSELVLTRNQLMQIMRHQKDSEFTAPLQRLNHVVSELQDGVMKTRMQPIGNAWAKLPRIVRDISLELGKKVELEMNGQDTELDRQVLEMIKDPLTHMVRNSADHGIETPAVREAAGKKPTGRIVLDAYHEGGHIIIEISDDGKGLSTQKIIDKAIANGIVTAESVKELSTQQIQQFIFNAGFSTAEKVTSVSGRGVGMDVVRTNIEKIGGSIELTSIEGKGSTFLIKIPLTLAIVSALIVEAGKERFAVPQLTVRELVMVSDKSEVKIELIKGSPVYRLRDQLLPLVYLNDVLKLHGVDVEPNEADLTTAEGDSKDSDIKASDSTGAVDEGNEYIIVTQIGASMLGIIVDRVFDTEEIVVKPVARILRDIEVFSGNTILGDGSVIMILDPSGIARSTGKEEGADAAMEQAEEELVADTAEKTTLLLFKVGDKTPKAVPLALVSRLENVNADNIEYANDQMLVQYRGQLMPLLPFTSGQEIPETGTMPVLVFAEGDKSMGIVVDEIVDIIEEHVDVQVSGTEGVMGSAIIAGRATDVCDVTYYMNSASSGWFNIQTSVGYDGDDEKTSEHARRTILLVDDSPFFRNMLTPLLSVAGYKVTSVEGAAQALELCERGETFDLIVSDIEMPDMSGFEFARKVKAEDSIWHDTPLVALTSHGAPSDLDKGHEVGFNKYILKFDRETLLDTLEETLSSVYS